jgi:hypothetical protein
LKVEPSDVCVAGVVLKNVINQMEEKAAETGEMKDKKLFIYSTVRIVRWRISWNRSERLWFMKSLIVCVSNYVAGHY